MAGKLREYGMVSVGRGFLAGLLALSVLHAGCGKAEPPPASPPSDDFWTNSPKVCAVDQVREYFCDGLLPLESALPAPPPYSNCPSTVEHHEGFHGPRPPVAVFDESYTEHIRKRMPPGHNCCYSWCATVEVRSLEEVLPMAGCNDSMAMRETYCLPTLEGGTSRPASDALPRCPVAIQPPEAVSFSVPPAAPLDMVATSERRSRGFDECCYGWCSHQPGGSQ